MQYWLADQLRKLNVILILLFVTQAKFAEIVCIKEQVRKAEKL